jgi:hypothetical protein
MPSPGNQGGQGSCVSWAVGYGVGSLYMNGSNTTNPYANNSALASPKYIYNQISRGTCNGTTYPANLNILQNQGVCSLQDMPYSDSECATQPNTTQNNAAANHKILRWEVVDKTDLTNIKSLIYAGYPVLIAVYVDGNFDNLTSPYIWTSAGGAVRGGHAITVTGWDNTKNAFKVLNSWGSNWADNGCLWIDYNFFSNAVIASECYVAYPIQGNPDDNLTNGLVLNLPFNGNAQDASGHNNNGTVGGATLVADRNGNANSAYSFGGYNNPNYIKIPNNASLQFSSSFTFATWVKINNKGGMDGFGSYSVTASQHCLFAKDFDANKAHALLNYSTNAPFNGFYTGLYGNTGSVATDISYTQGQWVHLVYTYSGNQMKMYKNGALVINTIGSLDFGPSNTQDLYLGRFASYWYPLDGILDEVRMYNRALTENEVQTLYQL